MPEHISLDENNPVWMQVVEIWANQMGVPTAQIEPDTQLVRDLGADSLDFVEVVMDFEEEFDISIPDKDADNLQLRSAREVYDYIRARV